MSKVFISIDLDAFYCAVEQHYDHTLTADTPFIVYQKNCIATLSYPARDMGLKKLGTVSEAVKKFPNIRLVNGESLAKYRAEGKKILDFVSELFNGCVPIERLGLEELRIDLTTVIDYNMDNFINNGLLDIIKKSNEEIDDETPDGVYLFLNDEREVDNKNSNEPYFCEGFFFNVPGKVFPYSKDNSLPSFIDDDNHLRLYVGAQLASYIMERISLDLGYNCSIGVGPNKTIAKMVCSLNKPKGLTVIFPEYVQDYLDDLSISKIPGFGHKTVKKIEMDMKEDGNDIFTRESGQFTTTDSSDKSTEQSSNNKAISPLNEEIYSTILTVNQVRTKKSRKDFVRIFGQKQGNYLYELLLGIDDSPVKIASDIPSQISIEDTYKRLDTISDITTALTTLLKSLIRQIYSDLIDAETKSWRIYPSTFRLTISRTDGNPYSTRKSKSCRLSMYIYEEIFSFSNSPDSSASFDTLVDTLSQKLLHDIVLDLFNQLANARTGEKLNVRLLNVAVTNFLTTKPTPFTRTTTSKKLPTTSKQSRGIMDRFLQIGR